MRQQESLCTELAGTSHPGKFTHETVYRMKPVLFLNHVLNAWPRPNAQLLALRVGIEDFARFVEAAGERSPSFMGAPVECEPDLPAGVGLIGFNGAQIRQLRIQWDEVMNVS
jgi:hypothetical protein